MFNRLSNFRPVREHPNLLFVFTFLLLNGLLFLPLYLFNQETTTLLPPLAIFANGFGLGLSQLFVWRANLDLLRLSLELTVLTALWVNVRWLRRPAFRHLFVAIYLLALCYSLYEAILSIYLVAPVFYSQYYLARDGLPFLFSHLQTSAWLYSAAIAAAVVGTTMVVILVNLLLASGASCKLSYSWRLIATLMALWCVIAGVRYQYYTARPEMAVSSLGFKLQQNIAASLQLYADVARFDDSTVRQAYDYSGYHLTKKPDIYLIFVESYGSVLYKRQFFRPAYLATLHELDARLHSAGWQTTSSISESPTWGGGSWMAYTSGLFGLRIDNQPQYLALLNKYQLENYPDLGSALQAQGYYYAWVSSITDELDDLTWTKYVRFLGVDQWLRYHDLHYNGLYYGWGPAPPDQYVLNYANTVLRQHTKQPLLFVTITQNSHYPWVPQPSMMADWHALSQVASTLPMANDTAENALIVDAPTSAEPSSTDKQQNYLRAVDYQLHMLTDFILHNGDENSLFVLIGDHQPPQVSRRADGWGTPIHIIAKDQALLDAFADYGFTPGLQVKNLTPSLHHEGLYSLLMRVLFSRYGADPSHLPTYRPTGVTPGQ